MPYLVEVCLHELEDHKNIFELTRVRRQQNVHDLHDVWVLQLAQQLDLTKDASGVLQQSSDEPCAAFMGGPRSALPKSEPLLASKSSQGANSPQPYYAPIRARTRR